VGGLSEAGLKALAVALAVLVVWVVVVVAVVGGLSDLAMDPPWNVGTGPR
jgi:hypothetical protein